MVRGNFTASKIAKAPLDDTTLGEGIGEAVKQAVGQ